MKKFNFKINILIYVFIVLFLILSFVSFKVSNSSLNKELGNSVNSSMIAHDSNMSREEVWEFLASLDDVKKIGSMGVAREIPIVMQEENDKEDPQTIVKKNASEKGVAKPMDAKTEVKKYENNETSFGIDVSTWQRKIDWRKVKQSGVSFAMIRAGFRKLDSGTIVMDNRFLDNIKGAIANNINVGVYFFSVATNGAEALEEAQWLVNVIKDYDITYPVAIDIEVFNQNRMQGVSYDTMTDNALIFCEYVRKMGYTPMIYSYANAFTKYFNTAKFKNERIWLAQYNDTVTYKGKYHMWQNTSDGSVPGIDGRVDMNVAYFSVTNDVTKASTVNGITNTGDLEVKSFIDMNMRTKLKSTSTLRVSPYNNLPNKAGSLDAGTDIVVTGMSDAFDYIRILYNGDTFYINDINAFIDVKEEVIFKEVKIRAEIKEPITLLNEPYNYLPNNIFVKFQQGEMEITGISDKFVRVKFNENDYYINNTDFYEVIENLTEDTKDEEEPNEDEKKDEIKDEENQDEIKSEELKDSKNTEENENDTISN